MFQYCETSAERKTFSGQSWYTSPSYARKVSILKIFWNTKRFPYEMRRYCEPKTLTRILMPTPFLFLNVFRYRKFSEQQKGSSTKRFGTVKQTISKHNGDVRPIFILNIFRYQNVFETKKGSATKCSLLRNKQFQSTVVMPPPFLSLTFFPSGKLSETQKGSLTNSFGIVKQNSLPEDPDTPTPLMHENFLS